MPEELADKRGSGSCDHRCECVNPACNEAHKNRAEFAHDFRSAMKLLTVGADESDGWNTAHLIEAQRLVAKYPAPTPITYRGRNGTDLLLACDAKEMEEDVFGEELTLMLRDDSTLKFRCGDSLVHMGGNWWVVMTPETEAEG